MFVLNLFIIHIGVKGTKENSTINIKIVIENEDSNFEEVYFSKL